MTEHLHIGAMVHVTAGTRVFSTSQDAGLPGRFTGWLRVTNSDNNVSGVALFMPPDLLDASAFLDRLQVAAMELQERIQERIGAEVRRHLDEKEG